jgi:hypothetical protein
MSLNFFAALLVGKTEEEALREIADADLVAQVRKPGDRAPSVYIKDRITIYVANGIVTRALIG